MEDENFLKENNIKISKITYSYKFPYNYKYKCSERGSSVNEERNKFLQSIYDRLLKLDDNNLILTRPHYMIELNYLYYNKYYNININNERIIFNNINIEDTSDLVFMILDLIGFESIEMSGCTYHNITYEINFGSCHINKIINISDDKNLSKEEQLYRNDYVLIHTNKQLVHVYNRITPNQAKFKIHLRGRNKWIIKQNINNGSVIDLYRHIKSKIILPNLLRYLYKDKNSLFNHLLIEIIDIIIDILQPEKQKRVIYMNEI
jgi:hypothetical protein